MFYFRMNRGMGWDGISKVSFNFLYTLFIYRSCIYIMSIYICNQKFSPTFLWVSKFDVKLRVAIKFSNLKKVGGFSIFGAKSSFSGEVGGHKI